MSIILLVIELSIFLLIQSYFYGFILLMITIIILFLELYKNQILSKSQGWINFKNILIILLRKKGITVKEENSSLLLESKDELTYTIQKTEETSEYINNDFIKTLRTIGIDGLLIISFMLTKKPNSVSVKPISNILQIPLSSCYKIIQKLLNLQSVKSYYTIDNPGKAFYTLTERGESLIFELYEFLGGTSLPLLLSISE